MTTSKESSIDAVIEEMGKEVKECRAFVFMALGQNGDFAHYATGDLVSVLGCAKALESYWRAKAVQHIDKQMGQVVTTQKGKNEKPPSTAH